MKLRHLPCNRAFAFLLGDSIVSMGGRFLFNTRADAVAAAEACGLTVARDGRVL